MCFIVKRGVALNKLSIGERQRQITRLIVEQGSVAVRELSQRFGVSTETIRKDLLALEKQKVISKGHGDATLSSTYLENPFHQKIDRNVEAKNRIAERAMEMIPEQGVVFLDSGSTMMYLAKLLNLKTGLVIVTNSLSSAQVLSNTENQLLVTGGELRSKSLSFVGSWALNSIAGVRADIAFIGCDGFHSDGPSIRSYRELEIKQRMIGNAKKAVLLCDSSKLQAEGLYAFATFQQFECLITDKQLPLQAEQEFANKITLVLA